MNPDRFLNVAGTLTRVTASETDERDEYNNPVPDESTVLVRCWLAQVQASEDTVDTDQQSETFEVYLPGETVVSGHDRLTVADGTFEFFGPPWRARHPRTGEAVLVVAKARRVR